MTTDRRTFRSRPSNWLGITALSALLLVAGARLAVADNATAADFTLQTEAGEPLKLSESTGEHATVLYFWASWCPYCKALEPHLQSVELEYGDDVEVLAINIFEDGEPASVGDYDFTGLVEGDDVAKRYGIEGTPGLLVVDGDRRIRFDLRTAPRQSLPGHVEDAGHSARAAHRAPYWAAQLRRAIDEVLAGD